MGRLPCGCSRCLAGRRELELFDDDGESHADRANPPCLLHIAAEWLGEAARPTVAISRRGSHTPRWQEVRFEDEAGRPLAVTLASSGGLRLGD